jgi:acetylornithine deacetylase/succinyl-diaminopimelate desuccinylase-like protein
MTTFDLDAARRSVDDAWDALLPTLCDYIAIPARSPAFDPGWAANGHIDEAVELLESWAGANAPDRATVEVLRLEGRTPLLVVDVPAYGTSDGGAGGDAAPAVLLYGHCDKQPEMTGWRDGLDPWTPVRDGDLLYGRGAADDGYAVFAALSALRAVRDAGGRHARCLVVIEASEETGSPDLPAYIDALGDRVGSVDLVVGLDAGCSTYDRLWVTTSLRGLVGLTVKVQVLTEGIHSGASGVVPSSFRILRDLLSRIEDASTGRILLPELHVDIPVERSEQAGAAAALLGDTVWDAAPFAGGTRPMTSSPVDAILSKTWRPALSVTGADGLPAVRDAGNVLRPSTTLKLSVRLPPTCDPAAAEAALVRALTSDVPYGADVEVTAEPHAAGWDAPPTAPWLADAIERASKGVYGQPPAALGEGGTIPFMAMLGERLPGAQFLITGVLGPGSNAHGPNEFLHVPMARSVTACVASVLHEHASAR